jgi:hypothetical protein
MVVFVIPLRTERRGRQFWASVRTTDDFGRVQDTASCRWDENLALGRAIEIYIGAMRLARSRIAWRATVHDGEIQSRCRGADAEFASRSRCGMSGLSRVGSVAQVDCDPAMVTLSRVQRSTGESRSTADLHAGSVIV